MGKPKQVQTQQNTYDWKQVPTWQGLEDFKAWQPQDDPTIPHRFATQKRQFAQTFQNPLGAYTTPELQRQQVQSGLNEISQAQGQAYRENAFDRNQQQLGQRQAVMAATRPDLVQTGGQTTQQQKGGLLGGLLQGGLSVAAAF